METQFAHNLFDRRFITKSKAPAVKWFREWVPQDVVATGGKCKILKWVNEETLRALKEKAVEPEAAAKTEPEPTTEVLFLCSYDGCGKTFIDAGALRKHSHVHGEKQHVCRYEGCGKKFLDSSKLKRHFLTHTGERDYVCPVEGCGKAFSLDFNLRSHMKTHSQENYHVCPFPDCGKRYAYEYKLKNHISAQHEKMAAVEMPKYAVPLEKAHKATKPSGGGAQSSAPPSVDRPYACPYEGCEKAYIHEYKLKLHFKNSHNGLMSDENPENEMDEASGRDAYGGKRSNGKNQRQESREKPTMKIPPSKAAAKKSKTSTPSTLNVTKKKPWPLKEDVFEEGDSEETEEDRDNVQDGWMHGRNNEDDDEETEYED